MSFGTYKSQNLPITITVVRDLSINHDLGTRLITNKVFYIPKK